MQTHTYRRCCVTVWLVAVITAGALHLALSAMDIGRAGEALALAAAGTVLVAVPLVVSSPLSGHLGLIGHLAGTAAIPLALPFEWVTVGALFLWTAGWASTAVAGERPRGSAVVELLDRFDRWLGPPDLVAASVPGALDRTARVLPSWLAVGGGAASLAIGLEAAEVVSVLDARLAAAVAILGAAYAGGARLLPARWRLTRALALGGVVLAAGGALGAAGEPRAGVAAAAASLMALVAVRPALRAAAMGWWGWVALALLAVQTVRAGGVWVVLTTGAIVAAGIVGTISGRKRTMDPRHGRA